MIKILKSGMPVLIMSCKAKKNGVNFYLPVLLISFAINYLAIMDIDKLYNPEHLKQLAKNAHSDSKKFVKKLKAKKPKHLDSLFNDLHNKTFETVDCLKCANCCRGLGPRITDKDIERLSKHLRLKQANFINQYLRVDEDGDYVFTEMPCPFLAPDNYCMVYESRPKACRDYPHTNHKKMIKHLNLAVKNAETCPAVYIILEDLKAINS